MNAITYDTLSIAKRLESAGLQKIQAEAIAGELRMAGQTDTSNLTTKGEFHLLKSEMHSEFSLVRSEMREMEARLKVQVGAMLFALGGILIAVKFFA